MVNWGIKDDFYKGGNEFEVLDTKSQDGVVFHFTEKPLAPGEVKGILDGDRRKQLMDHHTAVHIVGGLDSEYSRSSYLASRIQQGCKICQIGYHSPL